MWVLVRFEFGSIPISSIYISLQHLCVKRHFNNKNKKNKKKHFSKEQSPTFMKFGRARSCRKRGDFRLSGDGSSPLRSMGANHGRRPWGRSFLKAGALFVVSMLIVSIKVRPASLYTFKHTDCQILLCIITIA